jgi:hypothetical protein
MYFNSKEVKAWTFAYATPAIIKKLTGQKIRFVKKCLARGKLTPKQHLAILQSGVCPLVTPAEIPAPEMQAWRKRKDRPPPEEIHAKVQARLLAQQAASMPQPTPPVTQPVVAVSEPPPPVPLLPESHMNTYSNTADALPDDARLMILMASNRPIHPHTLYCIQTLCSNSEGRIVFGEPESIYDIFMARNRLADRFLQSGLAWSLWIDSDMVLPCERPEWFKRVVPAARRWQEPAYSGMNAVNRLCHHHLTNKAAKIVGAAYYDRFGRGIPMFAAGRDNPDMKAQLNNAGPRDALISAGRYAATGALLVHREVYLDIQKTQPEWAIDRDKAPWEGHGYGFFDKIDHQGDDVSLCTRAIRAGHQPMVDLAVCAAHIGDYAYTNEVINA